VTTTRSETFEEEEGRKESRLNGEEEEARD